MARDYKREYQTYQGTPEQIRDRAGRNAARRKLSKLLGAAAMAGQDASHKDNNPLNNSAGNLKPEKPATNRARKKRRM